MARYDVVDEALLPGTPEQTWAAFEDELAGRSTWWHPSGRMRLRAPDSGIEVGAIVDLAASQSGDVDARWGVVRLARRFVSVDPPNSMREEYVDGIFRGTLDTTLERVDDHTTRLRTHWMADLHGPLRWLLRFLDMEAIHHTLMAAQFEALRKHLAQQATR